MYHSQYHTEDIRFNFYFRSHSKQKHIFTGRFRDTFNVSETNLDIKHDWGKGALWTMWLYIAVFAVGHAFCDGGRGLGASEELCGWDAFTATSLGASCPSQKSHEVVILRADLGRSAAECLSARVTRLVFQGVFTTQELSFRPAKWENHTSREFRSQVQNKTGAVLDTTAHFKK